MVRYRRDLFRLAEAALVGLFFVQAVRFLYSTLYAHVASANLVVLTAKASDMNGLPGVVDPMIVQTELIVAGIALFAPLLSVILGRLWFGPALIAIVAAVGRVFITANGTTPLGVYGAVVAAGAGALYLAVIAIRRPSLMPMCMVLGFAADQLIRLYGNTADPTINDSFLPAQTVISLAVFGIAVVSAVFERLTPDDESTPQQNGEISGWSAFALGGLLYLEFAVLGLSNTVAHRAKVDYIIVAPWLTVATLLPLVAEVRDWARRFLGMFDGQFRGWVWFLMIGLLIVIGFRFSGPFAVFMLVFAQLMISLSWWWIVQPSDGKHNFTGPGVVFSLMLFLVLTGGDYLTYEYAFVRGVQEPFGSFLRAFRGLGLAVILFATLLAGLPAILARKRLPWRGGRVMESLLALALVVMGGVLSYSLARPVVASSPAASDRMRVATLNLHGGYSLYFGNDLVAIKNQIHDSGAEVVLLQEVETGRLVSYGVDQPAWLGRQLDMQVVYFPTNEGSQGLAILTKLPILESQGVFLTSQGRQTGVQFIRLRAPDQAELDVYNTQLSLLPRSSDTGTIQDDEQMQQLREIFSFISQNDPSLTNRTILGGTFNSLPDSEPYKYMSSAFIDHFVNLETDKAVTLRLVNSAPVRVDYLWLRQTNPRSVGVVQVPQSTHNMAVVEIGLLQSSGG